MTEVVALAVVNTLRRSEVTCRLLLTNAQLSASVVLTLAPSLTGDLVELPSSPEGLLEEDLKLGTPTKGLEGVLRSQVALTVVPSFQRAPIPAQLHLTWP